MKKKYLIYLEKQEEIKEDTNQNTNSKMVELNLNLIDNVNDNDWIKNKTNKNEMTNIYLLNHILGNSPGEI